MTSMMPEPHRPDTCSPARSKLVGESGLVGPQLAADDLEAGLPGVRIDPDPLDRARSRPPDRS